MSKLSVQEEVRKRDRFMCQYCGKRGEQYAHIIPVSTGGDYQLDNLIFLCYEHHQQLEPARSSKEMQRHLIEIAKKLRDRPKIDDFFRYLFSWPAGDTITVMLGGGIKFINQDRILENIDNPDLPYLRLSINELGTLDIDVHLDDSSGNTFMNIRKSNLEVHTSHALDIVIYRRGIRFEHKDKDIKLIIRQSKNMDLHISGSLYLNGGHFLITKTMVKDVNHNNVIEDCTMDSTSNGLTLAPGMILM